MTEAYYGKGFAGLPGSNTPTYSPKGPTYEPIQFLFLFVTVKQKKFCFCENLTFTARIQLRTLYVYVKQ